MSRPRASPGNGHAQSVHRSSERSSRPSTSRGRAAAGIDHRARVQAALPRGHVADVGIPEVVGRRGVEVASGRVREAAGDSLTGQWSRFFEEFLFEATGLLTRAPH